MEQPTNNQLVFFRTVTLASLAFCLSFLALDFWFSGELNRVSSLTVVVSILACLVTFGSGRKKGENDAR